MTRHDFPLPISSQPVGHESPWPRPEAEPINLIAVLPGEQPTPAGVIEALGRAAHEPFSVVDQPEARSPALWNALLAGPALPAPIVAWIEPMRPLPQETIDFLKIGNCRWAVGIETMLQHDQPIEHMQQLFRVLARALPQSPAILNVNTGGWHPREELEDVLLPTEMPAGPALTYIIHAISPEQAEGAAPPCVWAYTDGMRTTGRYELEMHGIAADQGRAAAFLLSSVAELVFEVGLPPPGEPFEIASGVFVRFMPWEQAAAAAPPECFGSTAHREDHAGRAPPPGARAAVCAMDSLSWPADAAGCLLRGEAVLFKTTQATERDGRIARHTLDHFARMFQSVPPARRKDAPDRVAAFMIKAGFAVPGHADAQGSGDREHLWFEATEVKNGRVRGTLLNDPMHVHLRRGDETWIDRNVISDWQVLTSRGQFGPLQHAAAAQTIAQALAGGPHG